jgi:hypothetical protein
LGAGATAAGAGEAFTEAGAPLAVALIILPSGCFLGFVVAILKSLLG